MYSWQKGALGDVREGEESRWAKSRGLEGWGKDTVREKRGSAEREGEE